MKSLFACIALLLPQAVLAAQPIELSSQVFVERKVAKPDGKIAVILEAPKTVVPGDDLVFVLKYRNVGSAPANDISVTNPMPKAVIFNGTADGSEMVSVDGGRNWGALSTLKLPMKNGQYRPAEVADVTHVKWKLNQSLSVGSEGNLIFRGKVR